MLAHWASTYSGHGVDFVKVYNLKVWCAPAATNSVQLTRQTTYSHMTPHQGLAQAHVRAYGGAIGFRHDQVRPLDDVGGGAGGNGTGWGKEVRGRR